MHTEQAIAYYKGKAPLAKALGIRTPSIYSWGDLVPLRRAYELQELTNGALKVDRALYQAQADK